MFKILNANLNRKQALPLPHHNKETDLADDFNKFFDEKIKKIRSKLDSTKQSTGDKAEIITRFKFSQFKALSDKEVKKLIMNMPVKHCKLDPLPTWLILHCIDEFLPIISKIVNISLTTGEMLHELKHALVRPLLKKAGLDLIKKSYRPVSNVSFLSKIIESAVNKQYVLLLTKTTNLTMKINQPILNFGSTATLLTKIHNHIKSTTQMC